MRTISSKPCGRAGWPLTTHTGQTLVAIGWAPGALTPVVAMKPWGRARAELCFVLGKGGEWS